jgi:hypothetical protein
MIGYYSGFYISLNNEIQGNGCIFENNIQTIAKSSFLINQRNVNPRIIANLLKIVKNTELFFNFERK